MMRSTVRKSVVVAVLLMILAIGMTGFWMMWSATRHENIDNDLFMKALAFLMLAITCWIPIQSVLKAKVKNTKATVKATTKSWAEKTGEMLAFQQKKVEQQA